MKELPPGAGCLGDPAVLQAPDTEFEYRGCRQGRALDDPAGVAVSRDARNVYVASRKALAILSRNRATGALSQPPGTRGCVAEGGLSGCGRARMRDPIDVEVSRGGGRVYAMSLDPPGIAIFARNRRTGTLRQLRGRRGCIEPSPSRVCTPGDIDSLNDFALSPYGRTLYAINSGTRTSGVVAFRQVPHGGLEQLPGRRGCVTNPRKPGCGRHRSLDLATSVVVTGEGLDVLVVSAGLVPFRRVGIQASAAP